MFLTSETKPPKIQILGEQTDIKNKKIRVIFAFNFVIDEDTSDETTIYSYYQYQTEIAVDLVFRAAISDILRYLYKQVEPAFLERIQIAKVEIPKEIDWE